MMNLDIVESIANTKQEIAQQQEEIDALIKTIPECKEMTEYEELQKQIQTVKPKKRKQIQERINEIEKQKPLVIKYYETREEIILKQSNIDKDRRYLENTESYLITVITNTITVMQKEGF